MNDMTVTEVCSNCMSENTMVWDVEKDGYLAYCPHCGKKMMLCDECMHSEENKTHSCFFSAFTNDEGKKIRVCFRDVEHAYFDAKKKMEKGESNV